MRTKWNLGGWAVAAAALLGASAAAAPAPTSAPASPESLRNEALALNEITGEDVEIGRIYQLSEDPAHAKALLAEAANMAKAKDQPFNINAALILARTADVLRDYDDAPVFYKIFIDDATRLESPQQMGFGYISLIKMYYAAGKYDESQKACEDFLALKGDPALTEIKPAVIRLYVLVLAKQGKGDDASTLLDKLIKAQPDSVLDQMTKGELLHEIDKPAEAIKAYESAINLIKRDEDIPREKRDASVNEIRYIISGLHMELNDVKAATDDLQALLDKDPDNPGYNNDLGYIWADHDMNLPEAEKMIRKAIDEDRKQRIKENPDAKPEDVKGSASYLDSLGWVLFKEKKYKEAKEPLEQAVKEPEGQSVEIYDHLGEVLSALGDKDAAVAAWKKGLDLPAETKHEKEKRAEVEKKLKGENP